MILSRVDLASSRAIPQGPNGAQISLGTESALNALWLNAKELITRANYIGTGSPSKDHAIMYSTAFFFLTSPTGDSKRPVKKSSADSFLLFA